MASDWRTVAKMMIGEDDEEEFEGEKRMSEMVRLLFGTSDAFAMAAVLEGFVYE
jgi:hypothetical protein